MLSVASYGKFSLGSISTSANTATVRHLNGNIAQSTTATRNKDAFIPSGAANMVMGRDIYSAPIRLDTQTQGAFLSCSIKGKRWVSSLDWNPPPWATNDQKAWALGNAFATRGVTHMERLGSHQGRIERTGWNWQESFRLGLERVSI